MKKGEGRTAENKVTDCTIDTGRPTLKKEVTAIGGDSMLVFKELEWVNHQENALAHMTHGSGCTWFPIMCVYEQVPGKEHVNSFFCNLINGKP